MAATQCICSCSCGRHLAEVLPKDDNGEERDFKRQLNVYHTWMLEDSAWISFYLAGALVFSGHNCASLSDGHFKVLQDWGQCWIGSTCPL